MNNIISLANDLLIVYMHLIRSEEAEQYIHTHLANYPQGFDGRLTSIDESIRMHIISNYCIGLIEWDQVQAFLELPDSLTNESFQIGDTISIQDLQGNDVACYEKIIDDGYVNLFDEEDEDYIASLVRGE